MPAKLTLKNLDCRMDAKQDTSGTPQTNVYDKEFPPLGAERQGGKDKARNKSLPDKREPPLSQKKLKALSKSMQGRPEGPEGEEDNLDLYCPTKSSNLNSLPWELRTRPKQVWPRQIKASNKFAESQATIKANDKGKHGETSSVGDGPRDSLDVMAHQASLAKKP
ncbi:hypothetical protein CEP51_006005 [Fusarium floridanum]|uniref:Uncharacterized protein n=1 Tax=Fusarium floridanum TaxID=1325733 RepID=A0A428RUH9_9HYPO|nr:hypothetical protein CEP51_006005 [Fusarium floridanum]